MAVVDETTIAVGSHSGLAFVDVVTRVVQERIPDNAGDYEWYQADPPAVRHQRPREIELLPAAGLWGGELPRVSADGWTADLVGEGAVLRHPDHAAVVIRDAEEARALGFSPQGTVLVFATSSTVHIRQR